MAQVRSVVAHAEALGHAPVAGVTSARSTRLKLDSLAIYTPASANIGAIRAGGKELWNL